MHMLQRENNGLNSNRGALSNRQQQKQLSSRRMF